MPIGEIAGEALGGVFRVVGRLVFEIFFELIIQGTGHVLIRIVKPAHQPSDKACAVVGLLFWAAAGVGGYLLYRAAAA